LIVALSTRARFLSVPAGSLGSHVVVRRDEGIDVEQTEEPVELVERVCALDIGKATVMACVRVPHDDKPGRRRQEVREYATRVPALLELADWLRSHSVQLVAMEATSSYWKPAFYLLEAEGSAAGC
jgi:hypothetical protein